MEEIYQRKELAYRCLIDAARSLSGAADIDELVGQILSSSRDVMQCWACSVSLPDPETGDLIDPRHPSRAERPGPSQCPRERDCWTRV